MPDLKTALLMLRRVLLAQCRDAQSGLQRLCVEKILVHAMDLQAPIPRRRWRKPGHGKSMQRDEGLLHLYCGPCGLNPQWVRELVSKIQHAYPVAA